jgi:cytochrome c-type biogenesis protein CcmF
VNASLGYGFVLGALACAAFGALVGLWAGLTRREAGFVWVRRAAYAFFACMLLANLTMVYALVTHDFSVSYVAQVGSRATPLVFTIVSLWSALEGSILFWGLVLGSYLLAFTLAHRRDQPIAMSLSLGTMLFVGTFFAFLIAGPANPFGHVSPPPPDGPGPNPLLQNHVLMIVHPPMLYLGYVGMTVPFGVAVGALLRGEISEAWMAPLRKWTLIAWGFLTVGIILGSWWAYAVLGWGGFWAWDPVENASFIPWLVATAFIHSTMVHERKRMLKQWTLSLALASFVLTLLGTFMTRSGVFNSVHSFTQSDIGPTFLVFIGIVLAISLGLLAVRGHLLVAEDRISSPVSRETSILVNNLLFTALTFTVLLGTLWPLINEALTGTKVSVGEPYFNAMAVPAGIAILFLMGVGPSLPWGVADGRLVARQLALPALLGAAVVGICLVAGLRGAAPLAVFGLSGFTTAVTLRELFLPARVRMAEKREPLLTAVLRSAQRSRRRFGGYVVHLGMVAVFIGVAGISAYQQKVTGTIEIGGSRTLSIGQYRLALSEIVSGKEPHRDYVAARLQVTRSSGPTEELVPRLNFYERSNDPIGTPAVLSLPHEDLYVSLLAFSEEGRSASFNVYIFPMASWIWGSLPLIVLGSLIAAWPARRRRSAESAPAKLPETGDANGAEAKGAGAEGAA